MTRSQIARRKQTPPELVTQIDQLLEFGDDGIVAERLNAAGACNWRNDVFTRSQVAAIRNGHGLRPYCERRLAAGYATAGQLAARYGVTRTTVRLWAQN